ncbi:MAG: HAD hydrolase family protein [Phycisphaeraceae bacterium]|nr:HAD hydrolase family protein [Phycisphaeraceae bacterium]
MALLVIDLDGTLLGRDGGVSAVNAAALHRARDAGIEIVLATGRNWKESRRAIDAINHDGLLVGAGGSVVNRAGDGATVRRATLDAEVVADCTRLLLEHGHRALLLKDHHESDHDYCLVGEHQLDAASRWWFDTHDLTRLEVLCPDEAHRRELTHGTLRVGSVAPSERLAACTRIMLDRHGGLIHAQQWGALTQTETVGSSTHLLEVFARGVDKWTAVEWICSERNIDPSRVVAIGDGLNDVGMVKSAGLGIAMGNAIEPVRQVADVVVAPFDRDGVAEAVDRALSHFGLGRGR